MADIEKLAPKIAKWEGGYVNDPKDRGGATNMGVTIATWKQVGYDKNNDGVINEKDIKLLTHDDFKYVLRKYWDVWKADQINNQSIANILVDWVWGSGKWGVIISQRILGLKEDGIVGPATLNAVNSANQKELFGKIYQEREKFLNNIVKNNPSQKRFINGWMNRLRDFKFIE
ncbi:peptidoglycan domain protein [Myroides odoratimimus]|uniref:glycoside hydrolase family 108 protein n=1 Tax=Myroides odoratimimus TaxID=76832 RepID=UPI002574EA2B|nr:glycosyl hydrolase 108 family protein [Myroides odoratimimus]MDM1396055.1 peptidoglycan domain protein [Myroides odoratimimus]